MSRPLRIEYPGACYHIINRGLERRRIFKSSKDYQYFLFLLYQMYLKYNLAVHSYCLMPNHYHLFVETPNGQLAQIMRQIDGIYTQVFNKRHNRIGPLMQGRYKSVLVDRENYSLELSRYIHLNPVRAKITDKPEKYQWSSYPAFVNEEEAPGFLNTQWLLSQFDNTNKKAIKSFRHFTLQGITDAWTPEKEAYKGLILGGSEFVLRIQDTFLKGKNDREIPNLSKVKKQLSVEDLQRYLVKLTLDEKLRRKLTVYALRKYSHLKLREIGKLVGSPSYAAAAMVFERFKQEAKRSKQVEKLVIKVEYYCQKVKC